MSTSPKKSSRRLASVAVDTAPIACKDAPEFFRSFLEGTLPPAQEIQIRRHLETCPRCAHAIKDHQQLHSLLNETLGARSLDRGFDERADRRLHERRALAASGDTSARAITAMRLGIEPDEEEPVAAGAGGFLDTLQARLGAAPWWIISGAFHALLLLLLTLIGMALIRSNATEVVIVSNLEKSPPPPEEQKEKIRDVFNKPVPVASDLPPVENPVVTHEEVEVADHNETADNMDDNKAKGDENAISDVNLGGTGTSAALGTGGGGGGAFGQRGAGGRRRLAARGGGGQATESAVDKALEWLAKHQEADGHWDAAKYQGKTSLDAGITGIALLAFLGAGHTEKVGKYKDNVQRAVKWIVSQQDADGSIGSKYKEYWHPGYAYHHAICGLALAEAAGMARIPATVEAAQKAVDFSTEKQQAGENSDKEAWRYLPKKDADASVSGWFVMQLKSAKIAGLHVNPASFEGATKFYDSIENKKEYDGYPGGRFPYQKGGQPLLNPSAIGILCNLFLGRKPDELRGGAEYLKENLPKWGDVTLGRGNAGGFPMYYTYYGTLTMFQMGGDYWKSWNEAMKGMLLPTQKKGGDEDGSWDPIGGKDDGLGGRVYMTAMGALCLEVYYRYLPITRH